MLALKFKGKHFIFIEKDQKKPHLRGRKLFGNSANARTIFLKKIKKKEPEGKNLKSRYFLACFVSRVFTFSLLKCYFHF